MKGKKVIILGGGVAGLSAAHELIKRKYEVHVYEFKEIPGGKARSTEVKDSATGNRKPLPGEHGFRFFPRFYRHVTATMQEIPLPGGGNVYDNLTETKEIRVARFGKKSFFSPAKFPTSLSEIKHFIDLDHGVDLGLTEEEKDYFAERIWQLMTSCYERRKNEYERMGWWEFTEADRFSDAYKTLLARGLTRTLVAARAEKVSTKTGGDVLLQLLFDVLEPGTSSDRILNGPTNEVWINPWLRYLEKEGVKYHLNATVLAIKCNRKSELIESVTVELNGQKQELTADYFISCVPVEVMSTLLNDDMLWVDPTLNGIKILADNVSWMNGLQLYLTENVPVDQGHTIYVDTPWAITSISQAQFWKDFNWADHGDGTVKDILSIDISDWFTPGILFNKCAKDCTKEEIVQECWEQVKRSLNVDGEVLLKDSMLHSWNLDNSIVTGLPTVNREPLLINNVNTWTLRPYAYCDIANLFMASDYVKTNTDLATMEGANEAARRAVNALLDDNNHSGPRCKIWKLHEPLVFAFFRWHDRDRYNKGLPWKPLFPFPLQWLSKVAYTIVKWFN